MFLHQIFKIRTGKGKCGGTVFLKQEVDKTISKSLTICSSAGVRVLAHT